MPNLPFNVIENILCRLPVKPLKRFRCVAKSWCSLIDSNKFVKSHLKRSLETNSRRRLIATGVKVAFKVDLDHEDLVEPEAVVFKPPFYRVFYHISNSVNGLFLVYGNEPILWNPFTTEYKQLPVIVDDDFPTPLGCSFKIAFGFAYDSKNDDYKVVKVVTHRGKDRFNWVASRAHIYSLKSNSWKLIAEKFNYPVIVWSADVNGALHTIVPEYMSPEEYSDKATVMAFSVESERHYEVKLPLGMSRKMGVGLALYKIGGSLSVNYATESRVDIWVMKDYGVQESWTKILSISDRLSSYGLDDVSGMKPLVYANNGHQVLLCSGNNNAFFWQDIRNQSAEKVSFKGLLPHMTYVEACVESLVSFRGEQVQEKVYDRDNEKDKKIRQKKRDGFLSTGFKLVL